MLCQICGREVHKGNFVRINVRAVKNVVAAYDAFCPYCSAEVGLVLWGKLIPNGRQQPDVRSFGRFRGASEDDRPKVVREGAEAQTPPQRVCPHCGELLTGDARSGDRRKKDRRSADRRTPDRRKGDRRNGGDAPARRDGGPKAEPRAGEAARDTAAPDDKRSKERRKEQRPVPYDRRWRGQDRRQAENDKNDWNI